MRLFGKKLIFSSPSQTDIVIFDECNSHIVRKVINPIYSIGVFHVRPFNIFLGILVVLQLLKELLKFSLKESIQHHRGLFYGILMQFFLRYQKACLEIIQPKAVVTFIDNNNIFGWLAKQCKKFPFVAIQNGSRLSYAANPNSGFYVPHYFCFGYHEQKIFPNLGYQVDHYYPVGSLAASLYLLPKDQVVEKYDLLVVSTWRGDIGFQQDVQDTMRSMKIMDQLLAGYIKDYGIKAALIYRAIRDSEHWIIPEIGLSEEEYYREIYGDSLIHIETDLCVRNIYPLMQQSSIIVTCLSTAAIEAYGLGKKVLYCNFTDTNLYHKDIDESILTVNRDYLNFSDKLNNLYNTNQGKYIKDHKHNMKYYMNFNEKIPVEKIISSKIDEIIEIFR